MLNMVKGEFMYRKSHKIGYQIGEKINLRTKISLLVLRINCL